MNGGEHLGRMLRGCLCTSEALAHVGAANFDLLSAGTFIFGPRRGSGVICPNICFGK